MQEPQYPHKGLCNGLLYAALALIFAGQLFFRTGAPRLWTLVAGIAIIIGVSAYKMVYARRQGMTGYVKKTLAIVCALVVMVVLLFLITAKYTAMSPDTPPSISPWVSIWIFIAAIALFLISINGRAVIKLKIKRGNTLAVRHLPTFRAIGYLAIGLVFIGLILMLAS